jgi:aminopeptidase-like protein
MISVDASALAREALELIRNLYPICRSITGDGVRRTLDRVEDIVPLQRSEVPSGTRLFDWEVPKEWNVSAAWIRDETGRVIVDVRDHTLHLVSYSVPFRGRLTLDQLRPHLHSMPEKPDWIPYRTSYYNEYWGFCMRHRDLQSLAPGQYDVCVDTSLAPGSLTLAEVVIPGRSEQEIVIYTHTCHPSVANDNLTGIALAALLAREMRRTEWHYTYRFVFGPGTIGSLAWLSGNEANLGRFRHGLVIGLLGDPGGLTYKESQRGDADIDRAARYVLPQVSARARFMAFEPYGYDERQFCSPGFNLPVGRLTRSPNGTYPEYHSSADNVEFIGEEFLAESIIAITRLLTLLDANHTYRNLSPKGEPRLGTRGLYGSVGGTTPGTSQSALLWVLNQSDGTRDLLSIAERSDLPFDEIAKAASALAAADLLEPEARVPRG